MDPKDISIAPLADAFLEQVKLMEGLDLDVASEFLVMAATLVTQEQRTSALSSDS